MGFEVSINEDDNDTKLHFQIMFAFVSMKTLSASIIAAFACTLAVSAAESTAKITDVHLCCKGCVSGVEKAVSKVPDAKAEVDQDAGTVTLSGPDATTVQKAADALVAAGYFGKASEGSIKLAPETGAKGEKVKSVKVEGVHLCCGKCVKAVDKATASVPGVKAHTATKGAKSFEVTGDFNDKDLMTALQKEGLAGKIVE
jgi:periplasmic mercuric ion binding protein